VENDRSGGRRLDAELLEESDAQVFDPLRRRPVSEAVAVGTCEGSRMRTPRGPSGRAVLLRKVRRRQV
jgi:hypothetical protein